MNRTAGYAGDPAISPTHNPAAHPAAGPTVGSPAADLASNPPERLTEELLERLLTSTAIEGFLDGEEFVDRELPAYLRGLLERNGLQRADVVRASGVNATFVYDIFAGKSLPGRDRALMLAFGLGCDLRQTQRLLRLAGVSELWSRNRRDAILIWCIAHGFSRAQADDELYRFGEKTMLGTGRLR